MPALSLEKLCYNMCGAKENIFLTDSGNNCNNFVCDLSPCYEWNNDIYTSGT